MAAFEFKCQLNPNHTLLVPAEVASQLRPNEPVRVVLVTGDPDGEIDWRKLGAEQFLSGYGPGDEIYDQLPAG